MISKRSTLTIEATNNDATKSKAYAVSRGYWQDPFIGHIYGTLTPCTPEISRGYFLRVQTFEAVTLRFIRETAGLCQIINLGAGSDTLFFRLKSHDCLPKAYVEIDLPFTVSRKISAFKQSKVLWEMICPDVEEEPLVGGSSSSLHSGCYHLMSFDLRSPPELLIRELCCSESGSLLSTHLPTLVLAECVLIYLPVERSNATLAALVSHFTSAAFLLYEQVNMVDKFGEVMIRNFRDRECELAGLSACNSIEDQQKRFFSTGWTNVSSWTINEVFDSLSPSTMLRIQQIEVLDDLEITHQLYKHYCILLASNDASICNWPSLKYILSEVA